MNKRLSESNLSDIFRNNDKITLHVFGASKYILDQGFGEYDKQLIVRYVSTHNNMVFCKILFDENNMSDLLYKAFTVSGLDLDELMKSDAHHYLVYDEYIYVISTKDFYAAIKEYINDTYFNKHRQLIAMEVTAMQLKITELKKITPQNILTI